MLGAMAAGLGCLVLELISVAGSDYLHFSARGASPPASTQRSLVALQLAVLSSSDQNENHLTVETVGVLVPVRQKLISLLPLITSG